jgi:hypothetical protein
VAAVTATSENCGAHAGVGEELRALALTALDRIDPVLDRLRSEPAEAPEPGAQPCAVCPVCAVIAALRGERPELAVRLAEHASGLATVLRAALEEGTPTPASAPAPEPSPARRVQRIRVERPAR